jgi:hypothetical protein
MCEKLFGNHREKRSVGKVRRENLEKSGFSIAVDLAVSSEQTVVIMK